jgi:hypothetical protein
MGNKYGNLVSDSDPQKGTEFGGVDGLIQPPPHTTDRYSASEKLMQFGQLNKEAGAITYRDGTTEIETQPIPESSRAR